MTAAASPSSRLPSPQKCEQLYRTSTTVLASESMCPSPSCLLSHSQHFLVLRPIAVVLIVTVRLHAAAVSVVELELVRVSVFT